MFGQLLDRVAAVQEDAFVAVNKRYCGFARGSGDEAGVMSKTTNLKGSFRPEAVVRDKEKTRHKGGKDAEPGHSICD